MTTETPDQQPKLPDDREIQAMCRPPALRFSKDMILFANKKFEHTAPFWAPLVAAFTMQNVILLSLLESFEPGSDEGAQAISTFYNKCRFEAENHWRSKAFTDQFGKKSAPKKSSLILAP